VVENRPSPLLWPLAYTTACTTVQAVIGVCMLVAVGGKCPTPCKKQGNCLGGGNVRGICPRGHASGGNVLRTLQQLASTVQNVE